MSFKELFSCKEILYRMRLANEWKMLNSDSWRRNCNVLDARQFLRPAVSHWKRNWKRKIMKVKRTMQKICKVLLIDYNNSRSKQRCLSFFQSNRRERRSENDTREVGGEMGNASKKRGSSSLLTGLWRREQRDGGTYELYASSWFTQNQLHWELNWLGHLGTQIQRDNLSLGTLQRGVMTSKK